MLALVMICAWLLGATGAAGADSPRREAVGTVARLDPRIDALAMGRVFFDATEWTKTYAGSADGKLDKDGNLFAAGPGGIFVLASDGTLLGRIITGVATSNCAWGGDGAVLYITASTAVYRIRLTTRGRLAARP